MLRGLTTVNYLAHDVAAAVDWYTELLGVEPYFSRSVEGTPAYAEFRIGDYQHELGILDRRFAASGRPGQILGGPAYDALIAFTAAKHQATLLSLDRRAVATYEAVGASVEQLVP